MTTPTKEQLLALALRVEQATGADRELDLAIFSALDMPLPKKYADMRISLAWNEQQRAFIYQLGDMQVRYEPALYTASLDAAMSLAPEGWTLAGFYFCPEDFRSAQDREWHAELAGPVEWVTFDGHPEPQFDCEGGNAANGPCAMVAAALRARAHALEVK